MTDILKNRNEMDPEYLWRLDHIFEEDMMWEKDFEKIEDMAEGMKKFQGKLGSGSEILAGALDFSMELSRAFEKVYVYAQMKSHEDSEESKYQAFASRAEALASKVAISSSFMAPEILSIKDDILKAFIRENERLTFYKKYLDEIIRNKPHVLSLEEEKLLAMANEVTGVPSQVYNMLNNADITFEDIKDENGNLIQVTKGKFGLLMQNEDREVRKATFKSFHNSYEKQKNTLGALLASNIKANIFTSKARNFENSREEALFDSNINKDVYDNLIKVVNKNLPLLHRYMALRKKAMGLEELHMYDLHTPMVKAEKIEISYLEAVESVKNGVAVLGEDYCKTMNKAFENGWIDVYENRGKRSGAYSWGCYDSHPYILLNHSNNINNMFTLVHELGHAMHSYYSDKSLPYTYAQYKIFVAEVASTFNEALLMNSLLNETKDKKIRLQLINYFMEQFRSTVFRQTMFAEFENIIHLRAEEGEAMTADLFTEIYMELNKKYYGADVILDKEIGIEWARIPHFYRSFYVYQYATGFSAAMALSKAIIEKKPGARESYLEFLKSGGSDYPVELLKKAGVDMITPEPVEKALAVFAGLLDEMEKEI